jgi:hypothetical protein
MWSTFFSTLPCVEHPVTTISLGVPSVKYPSTGISNAHSYLGHLGCPKRTLLSDASKHETSFPTPTLTGSVFRPNLVSEQCGQRSFYLVPRRAIFGLRLSFLHTRFYFAMNGWVILRRARITLLCECHLPDHSYLIKPSLP